MPRCRNRLFSTCVEKKIVQYYNIIVLLQKNLTFNTPETVEPEQIGKKYIDIEKILATKHVKLPKPIIHLLERILHVPDLNKGIYLDREYFGLDFVHKFLEGSDPQDLNIKIQTRGEDNIPTDGYPMIVGNHPLGGPDGLALMAAVGRVRKDIKFPVNDFLLYLPGLRELFYPIDKINKTRALASLEQAFADQTTLLYFPAGMCSRLQKGEIKDLEWKATFIKKAVKYHRDVVPVFTAARNRMSFYRIANLRKKLGIKFNFEMALLPAEMYAQRNKTFGITIGKAIPWQTFDNRHTAAEWASLVKEHVYKLKTNPDAQFNY